MNLSILTDTILVIAFILSGVFVPGFACKWLMNRGIITSVPARFKKNSTLALLGLLYALYFGVGVFLQRNSVELYVIQGNDPASATRAESFLRFEGGFSYRFADGSAALVKPQGGDRIIVINDSTQKLDLIHYRYYGLTSNIPLKDLMEARVVISPGEVYHAPHSINYFGSEQLPEEVRMDYRQKYTDLYLMKYRPSAREPSKQPLRILGGILGVGLTCLVWQACVLILKTQVSATG